MSTPIPSLTNNSRAESGASVGPSTNTLGGLNVPVRVKTEQVLIVAVVAVVLMSIYKKGRK